MEFLEAIKEIKPEHLVFVDEVGVADNLSVLYGRVEKGQNITNKKWFLLTKNGVLLVDIHQKKNP